MTTNLAKKEKVRRKNLKNFLRPWHSICEKRPHIPFAFVGFLKKQMDWR